jgi:hypothetical protein
VEIVALLFGFAVFALGVFLLMIQLPKFFPRSKRRLVALSGFIASLLAAWYVATHLMP